MPQLTPEHAFSLAVQHHQSGRLPQAEQLYRQVLSQQPRHAGALHLLGVIAYQVGRHDNAADLIRRAIALDPKLPDAHYVLGNVLCSSGRIEAAIAAYRQDLALRPDHAEAHNNLGTALSLQGQVDQAIAAYRQAIALRPDYAEALSNLGNFLREKGELDEAIAACREAIRSKPSYAEAHMNLGNALQEKRQLDEAIAAYRQAISLRPSYAKAHSNLGNALQELRRLDEAIAAYQQAIAILPDFAEAYSNLGNVLTEQGKLEEAVAAYRKAIAIMPRNSDARISLGNALHEMGRLDEAIAAYRDLIVLKPDYAEAHSNLGNALNRSGRVDEAIAAYRQALALKPDYAEAYCNLSNALRDKGLLEEAIHACRQAITLNPSLAEAHSNLGNVLSQQGLRQDAIVAYQQAISLRPDYADAYSNLGHVLQENGQLDEAIAAYERAIALKPNMSEAHNNLGGALQEQGRLDEALAAFRKAVALKLSIADSYQNLPAVARSLRSAAASVHSNVVYAIHFHPDYDAARLLQESRQWAALYEAPLAGEVRPHENDRDPDRRLKIGYVSPDFRTHAAASFLLPLLANHDARNVEVYCYASVKREDAITAKFKQLDVVWRNCLGIADTAIADMIRRDGIDILVDLTLHMAHNRLLVFARKPAPVQVTWLGYPGTTGMSSIDYRLTDRFLDPPGQTDQYYTERSIRLPNSFWCYQPLIEETPDVSELPALENGYMTFGCFNNFAKVTAETLRLWMRVLETVPNSRLIVLSHPGSHRGAAGALFHDNGIASDRVEFVDRAPPADYFKYYHRVDLCLDPVPCPGHTSSLDALWMGVPIVTLSGNTAVSRGGESILSNIGLPEFIARSSDQYVSIAAEAAGAVDRLGELRRSLRATLRASPLMDGRQFAADFESAYRQMWRNWCASDIGTPPPGGPR